MTEHLPTVASSVNLTSLELADCILEFSHLSQEVTGGIQAGTRTIQASEQTFRNGGQALRKVVDDVVMPGIRKRVEASGGAHLPVTQYHCHDQACQQKLAITPTSHDSQASLLGTCQRHDN